MAQQWFERVATSGRAPAHSRIGLSVVASGYRTVSLPSSTSTKFEPVTAGADGSAFVFGGTYATLLSDLDEDLAEVGNAVYEFTARLPVADGALVRWREVLTKGSGPCARAYQAMAFDPFTRRLYILGGVCGSMGAVDNTLYILNLGSSHWTRHPSSSSSSSSSTSDALIPSARSEHTMVIDASGSVVLFGGLDNHGVPLNDVWRFDTNKMRWSQIACVGKRPAPRRGHRAAISHDGLRMFIIGGYGYESDDAGPHFSYSTRNTVTTHANNDNEFVSLHDLWCLDLATRTWIPCEAHLPSSVEFLSYLGRKADGSGTETLLVHKSELRRSRTFHFDITINGDATRRTCEVSGVRELATIAPEALYMRSDGAVVLVPLLLPTAADSSASSTTSSSSSSSSSTSSSSSPSSSPFSFTKLKQKLGFHKETKEDPSAAAAAAMPVEPPYGLAVLAVGGYREAGDQQMPTEVGLLCPVPASSTSSDDSGNSCRVM